MLEKSNKLLASGLVLLLIGIIIFSLSACITPRTITYQTNYYDFYSPFSDIYIKEMVPSISGSTVYFYPEGMETFSFTTDGTIRKNIGKYFIECTRSGNGEYITITDTDIPFLPKINPFVWGMPIGDNNDFEAMKELFKSPREGACDIQTDFMIGLADNQGVITRRINLWQSPLNGMLTAGGHTTMEIYDRKTKQWVWMDPLYNIIEGKTWDRSLTLYELQIAINHGENITLTTTDGEEILFDRWEHALIWKSYLNPSQIITYVTPAASRDFKNIRGE